MAKIECIKSKWIRNVECFGNTNVFFTGLKISEGNKIRYYPQPVNAQLKGKLLIIRDNGREDVWDLSTSALTHQQIKALIANCSCCNDGSPLCQTFFVEEAQSEFAINVPTGSVLAANTLLVFINGQQKPSNSVEFGWSITGTAPNYTVTFNDDIVPFPGQPPHEVTICYGYNTSIPSEYVTQEELDAIIPFTHSTSEQVWPFEKAIGGGDILVKTWQWTTESGDQPLTGLTPDSIGTIIDYSPMRYKGADGYLRLSGAIPDPPLGASSDPYTVGLHPLATTFSEITVWYTRP